MSEAQPRSIPWRRLDHLFDPGSARELQAQRVGAKGEPDGDGLVTAFGSVGGRTLLAYAQDPTYRGGSLGRSSAEKLRRLIELARENRHPVIGIHDGAGARIDEGLDALVGYTAVGREITRASGVVPQIAVIAGVSAGGPAYSALMMDFVVMVREACMFVTGPEVIQRLTGEVITREELGGSEIHARHSGSCHLVADDDAAAIRAAARLVGYLPDACDAPQRVVPCDDPVEREAQITPLLPADARRVYDVRKVVAEVLDRDSFLEIHAGFARNIVVGFGRLAGRPVGVLANQPIGAGGIIDSPASRKAARFLNCCSAFGVPVLTFVDTPGFVSGRAHEKSGILIAGAALLQAYAGCRSPKLTLCLRKAYGGAFSAMGSKALGAEFYYALPNAELAVMGPSGAWTILRKRSDAGDESEEAFVERYRRDVSNPVAAAASGHVDAIVAPEDTRRVLASSLALLASRPLAPGRERNPPL